MSEAEPANATEEQQLQEKQGGNGEQSKEKRPLSTEGTPPATGNTHSPVNEPKAKGDCATNTDGAAQAKIQSIFTQVRNQIKSQVSTDFHKKGILDVVQRVTRERAREINAQKPSQTEGKEGETVEEGERTEEEEKRDMGGVSSGETAIEEIIESGLATLRAELLANIESLRNDFKTELALLRADAHDYTDKAVKGLEEKTLSTRPDCLKSKLRTTNSPGQQVPVRPKTQEIHKSRSVPSLVLGRPRILNRTMTTLNPKMNHSVALSLRSKSETLSSAGESKGAMSLPESSEFHIHATESKKRTKASGQLPPACPALSTNKKLVKSKARMDNLTS